MTSSQRGVQKLVICDNFQGITWVTREWIGERSNNTESAIELMEEHGKNLGETDTSKTKS